MVSCTNRWPMKSSNEKTVDESAAGLERAEYLHRAETARNEMNMRTRQVCRIFLIVTIAVTTLNPTVLATKAEGYECTSLARGRLGAIDISCLKEDGHEQIWRSRQKMKGLSVIYEQSNIWAPDGSTGWHSHPGKSLIFVTARTVTNYERLDAIAQCLAGAVLRQRLVGVVATAGKLRWPL